MIISHLLLGLPKGLIYLIGMLSLILIDFLLLLELFYKKFIFHFQKSLIHFYLLELKKDQLKIIQSNFLIVFLLF